MSELQPPRTRRDVHQEITDQIIAAIEAGTADFEMPWHRDPGGGMPVNALSERAYNGVNVLALWVAARRRGYSSNLWATYKQWSLLGAQVRKGERGNIVVFYKETKREVIDEDSGETDTKRISFARATFVFNADQVDGWHVPKPALRDEVEVIGEVERFVGVTGADIRHGGDSACYALLSDHIQMPERERFKGSSTSTPTESYYATLLHELTHWSGHKKRLNRDFAERFRGEAYAMEELVAELGSAFLCSELGVTNEPRPDHAAYVAAWLEVLRRDKRAIFTAASKASEAKEYLADLQGSR